MCAEEPSSVRAPRVIRTLVIARGQDVEGAYIRAGVQLVFDGSGRLGGDAAYIAEWVAHHVMLPR